LEDWATLFGLLREAGHPVSFSAMAHRTDLFGNGGEVPYQALHLRTAHQVLCIARDGVDELAKRHPAQAYKLRLVRLGTVDRGIAPWSSSEELRLVSCSYITPRKRVERIAEALLHMQRPVRWTHFGDGPDRTVVDAIAQRAPAHVHIDLRGAISNPKVLHAYANERFDAFIHLSEHEGVPVALMEAASFGIPLLATDAGGVKELVDTRTGVLWPVDIAPEEVARWLDSTAMDALRTSEFRAGVRAAWQEQFEAERAYGHIADLLLGEA
jgi:glycosyltransferase involved in cell wall biosynthesis